MASNGCLGTLWGHFGVALGSLWVTLGSNPGLIRFWTASCAKTIVKPMDFSLFGRGADAGRMASRAYLGALWGHFGDIYVPFWGHFGCLRHHFGRLWRQFEIILNT